MGSCGGWGERGGGTLNHDAGGSGGGGGDGMWGILVAFCCRAGRLGRRSGGKGVRGGKCAMGVGGVWGRLLGAGGGRAGRGGGCGLRGMVGWGLCWRDRGGGGIYGW